MERRTAAILLLLGSLGGAFSDGAWANCATDLVDSATPSDPRLVARGFLEARGRGERNGTVLADFLADHFAEVPGAAAAITRLRHPTLFPENDYGAMAFWRAAGILPADRNGPTAVISLTYDGFPVVPIGPDYFSSAEMADREWLTDVVVQFRARTDRKHFSPLHAIRPRLERLRSLDIRGLGEEGSDEAILLSQLECMELFGRLSGLWELSTDVSVLRNLAPLPTPLEVVRLHRRHMMETQDSMLWQIFGRRASDEGPVAGTLSGYGEEAAAGRRREAAAVGRALYPLRGLRALELRGPLLAPVLSHVRTTLQALRLDFTSLDEEFEGSDALSRRLSRFKRLDELELTHSESSELLLRLPTALKRLKVMVSASYPGVRWLQRLRQLEYLDLEVLDESSPELAIPALPNTLRCLRWRWRASKDDAASDRAMAIRLPELRQLEHLELDLTLFPEAIRAVPRNLERLGLRLFGEGVNARLEDVFSRTERLRRLDLVFHGHLMERLTALAQLPSTVDSLTVDLGVPEEMNLPAQADRALEILRQTFARPKNRLHSLSFANLSPDPGFLESLGRVLAKGTTLRSLRLHERDPYDVAPRESSNLDWRNARHRLATALSALSSLRRLRIPAEWVSDSLVNATPESLVLLEVVPFRRDRPLEGMMSAAGARRFLNNHPHLRAVVGRWPNPFVEALRPYWTWHE